MLIVFEGPDGAGKTTLANLLAKRMSAKSYPSVPDCLADARSTADQLGPNDRFLFYHLCNSVQSWSISRHDSSDVVILDRYFYTTATYHQYTLNFSLADYLAFCSSPENYEQPDAIVFVSADPPTRAARMQDREITQWDQLSLDADFLRSYEDALKVAQCPIIRIDTTHGNAQDACTQLIKAINLQVIGKEIRKDGE